MPLQDKQLKESIAKSWDESSINYDSYDGHGIKSTEERDAWKGVLGNAIARDAKRVLDVGCGTGEMSLIFAEMGYETTGIDLSEKMLSVARAKAQSRGLAVDFRTGDAEALPFDDGSFDVVFNRHLLWTLPHPQDALDSWRKVLKDGGRAIIVDGLWDDGSVSTRIRRSVSYAGTRIFEGKEPHRGQYSPEMNSALPNAGGTPIEKTREYIGKAGFQKIGSADITYIREIQRKQMSFWARLNHNYSYYLIYGER